MAPSSKSGIKLVLHGALKAICPEDHTFYVASPLEALKALFTQIKGFKPTPGQLPWRVAIVGLDKVEDLASPTDQTELHIVPDYCGGKSGGFMQIVIGMVIIAASFMMPAAGLVLAEGLTITAGSVFMFGAAMVLGGILAMMSPAPKLQNSGGGLTGDPVASKYLGAPKNTVAIGTPIPLMYGFNVKASGHYLSFDIRAVDVAL